MKKISLVTVVALVVLLIAAAVPAVSAETITGSIYKPLTDVIEGSSGFLGSQYYGYKTPNDWGLKIDFENNAIVSQIVIFEARVKETEDVYVATENYFSAYGYLGRDMPENVATALVEFQKLRYNAESGHGIYTVVMNLNWNQAWLDETTDRVRTFYFWGFPTTKAIYFTERDTSIPEAPSHVTVLTGYAVRPYSPRPMVYHLERPPFEQIYEIITDHYGITIDITRVIDGRENPSKIIIKNLTTEETIYESETYIDIDEIYYFPGTEYSVWLEAKHNPGTFYEIYRGTSGPEPTPTDPASVTVYVKNSQTGALIADANIVIDALVNDEYYPVVNRTEPSGIFSITLQPTGGGQPNPDGYRLIVTADGYNNPMPEINFTVDDSKNYIHCLLDPIAGGPVNENKTFIDFFVRDMSSNPISGATVKFGKYTLITNSAGYTIFEVDKNNNYAWTISKSGYGALTGNAVIGAAPRHTINTVLAPAVTPIKPTPIPTSPPIGPTPTMTAPTGEPVSNWLEWFAAHFGMILGGGVEIGKIFMWLCFTVPVGVYVGKEAKAGAAGFMAGAGIVTLFFVLVGWVPIWLVVLLALIIGLLYAKEFNAPDNGGGR